MRAKEKAEKEGQEERDSIEAKMLAMVVVHVTPNRRSREASRDCTRWCQRFDILINNYISGIPSPKARFP